MGMLADVYRELRAQQFDSRSDQYETSTRAELKAEFSRWAAVRRSKPGTTLFECERTPVAIVKLDRLAATVDEVPPDLLAEVQAIFSKDGLTAQSREWQYHFEAVGFFTFPDNAAEFCRHFIYARDRFRR